MQARGPQLTQITMRDSPLGNCRATIAFLTMEKGLSSLEKKNDNFTKRTRRAQDRLDGELLEVQPVAREDEADEVVAGRRLDRAKSTD